MLDTDGINFERRAAPVLAPETEYERDGGIEDPRLVRFGDTYYLTYTGYNKKDAQLCLATSKDLIQWERKGVILPAHKGRWNVGWTKAGAIVPEKLVGHAPGSPLCYPRPMYGIFVAITVMNGTLASSGRLAM